MEGAPSARSSPITWRHRAILIVAVLAVLVAAYFILAAFVPRWWAQRIATMSGHGSFSKGIWSGLGLGFVCTLAPLLLLLFAAWVWRRRAGRFLAGAAAVLAAIVALPNLMTLAIVAGGNNAAHAGERILDVDAPGFRGACLIGTLAAAALMVLAAVTIARRRLRKRRSATHPPAPAAPPSDPPRTNPGG
jgi:ABC-type Fe3+ transport system permease subunit